MADERNIQYPIGMPESLRQDMKNHDEVAWANVCRNAIYAKLRELETKEPEDEH